MLIRTIDTWNNYRNPRKMRLQLLRDAPRDGQLRRRAAARRLRRRASARAKIRAASRSRLCKSPRPALIPVMGSAGNADARARARECHHYFSRRSSLSCISREISSCETSAASCPAAASSCACDDAFGQSGPPTPFRFRLSRPLSNSH